MDFFKKWYTYQKERFPVSVFLFYVLCIVIGTFLVINMYGRISNIYSFNVGNDMNAQFLSYGKSGGVYYTYGIKSTNNYNSFINKQSIITISVMTICGFLQFLMVRIIDEFKDYEEDCKYRAYRPVPRGLITLKELKYLFAICFVLQILLTYFFKGDFIALLFMWLVFFLMTKGFFIKDILDKHQILELILDEIMMPFMVLYLASFATMNCFISQTSDSWNIWNLFTESAKNDWTIFVLFLFMTYMGSCIVEVARKVRSKEKEEKGVKTYTAVFGISRTMTLITLLEIGLYLPQALIFNQILPLNIFSNPRFYIIVGAFLIPLVCNFNFNINQTHKASKMVELSGNLYVAFAYLSMIMLYI